MDYRDLPDEHRSLVEAAFARLLETNGENLTEVVGAFRRAHGDIADSLVRLWKAHLEAGDFLSEMHIGRLVAQLLPDELVDDVPESYRIVREIGRGGMGVVYLAEDERLKRKVALKFITQFMADDPKARERFLSEARAASKVDHPNIATVYEIGETPSGRPYISLAYYEGETLDKKISAGPVTIDSCISIVRQSAEALAAAHDAGLVHRDVKPANILVTDSGEVKLLDFGIAKTFDGSSSDTDSTPGTVAYMSPEQARSEDVDARTDIWSLSVVLYEMLAGERPFKSSDRQGLIYSICNDSPPDLTGINPDVSETLALIVATGLQKDPTSRYQTMGALVADLDDSLVSRHRSRTATPYSRYAMVAAGMVLLIAATTYGLSIVRPAATGSEAAVPGFSQNENLRLVVMPFENSSSIANDDFLATGLADEIRNQLANTSGIQVTKAENMPKPDGVYNTASANATLQPAVVLEGKTQLADEKFTVETVLRDTSDESIRWSKKYSTAADSIGSLSTSVSRDILDELGISFREDHLERHDVDAGSAFTEYVKGRYYWDKRDEASVRRALDHFGNALDIDPAYPMAWVGIANAYIALGSHFSVPESEAFPRARAAAERALEIEPDLAAAHTALAAILTDYYWDWKLAGEHFARAVTLDPDNATTRQWYAQYLNRVGRLSEAIEHSTKAEELNPLSPAIQQVAAEALYLSGQHQVAVDKYLNLLSFHKDYLATYIHLGLVYQDMGRYDDALEGWQKLDSLWHGPPNIIGLLGYAYARSDRKNEALRQLERLETVKDDPVSFHKAVIHIGLEDYSTALNLLEAAVEEKSWLITIIKTEPVFDPLRQTPQFDRLLDTVGLSDTRLSASSE